MAISWGLGWITALSRVFTHANLNGGLVTLTVTVQGLIYYRPNNRGQGIAQLTV